MTLKVSDKICEGYITPQWPLPPSTVTDTFAPDRHTSLEGRLGVEFGADKWGLIPGVAPMLIGPGQNGRRIMGHGANLSGDTTPRHSFGNVWKLNTFSPDHYSEVAHNPPITGEPLHTSVFLDCGPAVRQDPNSNSCYCMGLWYHDNGNGHPDIHISRINNGVRTLLAVATLADYQHANDWWYMQLQAWGQNPVKLRVVTKAPTIYVPGTASIDDDGYLPGIYTYAFPQEFGGTIRFSQYGGDVTKPGEPSEFWLGLSKGTWAEYGVAPANEDGVPALGQTVADQRVWTVWEGEDSSPDRLLSGQPGVRGLLSTAVPLTNQGFSDFVAGDLDGRLTVRVITPGTTMTIGGYKASGTTVSVLTAVTVSGLTQTDTTWEAVVTDYEAFSSISVSDGTATADVNSDFTAPTVDTFTVLPTSSSLTIPITALGATDNFGVTGYIVTSDNTPPFKTDARWAAATYWISNGYPVAAAGTHTLYAWAKDAAGNVSSPATATVEVHQPVPTAATWQATPAVAGYGAVTLYWNAGNDANSYTVLYSRNSALDAATYDGANPYPSTPGLDNGKIEGITELTHLIAGLRDNTTYYFRVMSVNTTGSALGSSAAKATLRNPQVTVSPVEGTYASAVTVTLTRANYTGGSIYYTLDGSDPKTNGVVYSAPFVIGASATLRVQAYEAVGNGVWGEAKSYGYFIPPMVNVIPPAGAYASPQTVTITPANYSGGAIYYTLDGSMPTTASTPYTGPITVSSSATIKVLPVDGSGTPGTVQTATYVISAAQFSVDGCVSGSTSEQLAMVLADRLFTVSEAVSVSTTGHVTLTLTDTGGTGIRSPSGRSVMVRSGTGRKITARRYINGVWK